MKGKGLSLDIAPDEELSDGGYSSVEEFKDKETLFHNVNTHIKSLHIIQ